MNSLFLDFEVEGSGQRTVQMGDLFRGQRTQVARKKSFGHTHQLVAQNAGIVFQAFVYPNVYLCAQTASVGVHRRTDNGRETRIDQGLCTYDNESTLPSGIERVRPRNQINFATQQLLPGRLVGQDVLRLSVELISMSVDDRNVPIPVPFSGSPIQVSPYRTLDEIRPVGPRAIDFRQQFLRKEN